MTSVPKFDFIQTYIQPDVMISPTKDTKELFHLNLNYDQHSFQADLMICRKSHMTARKPSVISVTVITVIVRFVISSHILSNVADVAILEVALVQRKLTGDGFSVSRKTLHVAFVRRRQTAVLAFHVRTKTVVFKPTVLLQFVQEIPDDSVAFRRRVSLSQVLRVVDQATVDVNGSQTKLVITVTRRIRSNGIDNVDLICWTRHVTKQRHHSCIGLLLEVAVEDVLIAMVNLLVDGSIKQILEPTLGVDQDLGLTVRKSREDSNGSGSFGVEQRNLNQQQSRVVGSLLVYDVEPASINTGGLVVCTDHLHHILGGLANKGRGKGGNWTGRGTGRTPAAPLFLSSFVKELEDRLGLHVQIGAAEDAVQGLYLLVCALCVYGMGTYIAGDIGSNSNTNKGILVFSTLVVVHVSVDRTTDYAMEVNLLEVVVGNVFGFFAQHGGLDHVVHGGSLL